MADEKIWVLTMFPDQYKRDHYLVKIKDNSICMPTTESIQDFAAMRRRHLNEDKIYTMPEELAMALKPSKINPDKFKKVNSENVAKREKAGKKDTFTWNEYLDEMTAGTLKSKFSDEKILKLLK